MEAIPHEYIYCGRCELTDEEYYYFLYCQTHFGREEWWGKGKRPYLYIDGYKYWTMGDYIEENKTMNRQKVFSEFDFLDWPLPKYYTQQELEIMVRTLLKTFKGRSFFEAGFGNGNFPRFANIEPERYYGVDPSKKAIRQFRSGLKGFYRRCANLSFEESIEKWKEGDSVVIALFGSASYFMRQYLEKLVQSGLEYCLMFFKPGCVPECFSEMHEFTHTMEDLKSIFDKPNLFVRTYFYTHEKYITVTTRELIWQKPESPYELFPV